MKKLMQTLFLVIGLGSSATLPVATIPASVATAAVLVTVSSEPAMACDPACEIAKWQATREPFTHETASVFVDTCVRLLSTDVRAAMTEVVLIAGDDPVNGRVITSLARGAGFSFKLSNQPKGTEDVYVREFCFDGSLIEDLSAITFCNGLTPGDGNHHTLSMHDDSAVYLRNLKRTGHAGDFLTLLGTQRSYNAPISTFFTASLYSKLFGAHGDWLGS